MTRLLLLLLAFLPCLAVAEPVRVQSGEHDGFTRLVFDYRAALDWQVGRTSDGYELRTGTATGYDFTGVFDLIGKGRLAAIWADPDSGALRIGIACACHAIPFEFRPGIVVVDLRDGPPPDGSSFELSLEGTAPATAVPPPPRPRPRPEALASYNWLEVAATAPQAVDQQRLSLNADPALQPLRDALLRNLSRGAAQGVIDMAKPARPAGAGETVPSVAIHAGDLAGTGSYLPEAKTPVAANGQTCPPSETLDLGSWGDARPVSSQLADYRLNLVGEFDKPDSAAVSRAVKFHLFLGFGAEARQFLQAFPSDVPDAALWRDLSYILDAEPEKSRHLGGMASCDSAAALWGILSDGEVDARSNQKAALLAFSALPSHLRHLLGPSLAKAFLDSGYPEPARAIRDAILRAPATDPAAAGLLQAEMDLHAGNPAQAEANLTEIMTASGPEATQALLTYVEARFAQTLPVEPDIVPALEAIVQELTGAPAEPAARRALILAQALSGDFASAFSQTDAMPEITPAVWQALAHTGSDSAILEHGMAEPSLPLLPETAEILSQRLLDLGFARPAARWLAMVETPDPILNARVRLATGDPKGALTALGGIGDPASDGIRAAALTALGDPLGASKLWEMAGNGGNAVTSVILSQDWQAVAGAASDPWQAAAKTVSPTPLDAIAGPLARGETLVAASNGTRLALTGLLETLR